MRLQELGFVLVITCMGIAQSGQVDAQSGTQNQQSPPGEEVVCTADLTIKKVQLLTSDFALPFKIVIGHDFEYKAKPPAGTWNWIFINGTSSQPYDMYNDNLSVALTTPSGTSSLTPMSSPITNDELGGVNALLQVSNGSASIQTQVEVFFDKDAASFYDPGVPNWFFYWTQELPYHQVDIAVYNPEDESTPGNIVADINFKYSDTAPYAWDPAAGMTLGHTTILPSPAIPVDLDNPGLGLYALEYEINMTLGEGVSKMCAHSYQVIVDQNGNILEINPNPGTGYTGISCFAQVFIHEYEHIMIFLENWPIGFRTGIGYDTDGDSYSDDWEIAHLDDGFNKDVPTPYSLGEGTVGYEYEEGRCRMVEDATNPNLLMNVDWSFDSTNKYQGKNWKK